MNCQQNSGFRFFAWALKNGDPKSSKKSSPGGQHEPQERLRRSQERPKRPQDGPKSALRAARSAPRGAQEQPGAHQKGPKRAPGRPRSAKKPPGALREAPGVHFGIILGGSGPHFQAIEASFSKLARAPPDNRKTLFEMTGQKVLCWVGRRLGAANATTTREFTLSPAKTS